MTKKVSSRRGFIGAAGLLAAGSLMPGIAAATSALSISAATSRLSRLIALHDRAEAECQRFDEDVEMPARQACVAAIKALPVEASPPHEKSATSFVNAFGDTVQLSAANVGTTAIARRILHEPSWADTGDEAWRQAHREIAAAADQRDAVLADQATRRKALEEKTRRSFHIDALAARAESLAVRRGKLWDAVMSTRADSLADVVTKLSFIDRTIQPDEIDNTAFAAIGADVRRLAGGEA